MTKVTREFSSTEYFDCTIRAGFYNLAGYDVAHHTYAIVTDDRTSTQYALPCFGSFALREGERGHTGVVYPGDLWTPWIVGATNQGPAMSARLSVAMGMAQFSLSPRLDWTVALWDAHWAKLPEPLRGYSPACWAGLIYGVSGVCHQACNRILWSSRLGAFDYTPVNWPPSLSASYWVYGFYGKAVDAAAILATALVVIALLGVEAADEETLKSQQLARSVMDHQIVTELRNLTGGGAREHEVRAMLDYVPDELKLKDAKLETEVVRLDRLFSDRKREFDARLYNSVTDHGHDEYAGAVNQDFNRLLTDLRNVMPPETFAALFPDAKNGKRYGLIDRRLMPPNYVRHRSGLEP